MDEGEELGGLEVGRRGVLGQSLFRDLMVVLVALDEQDALDELDAGHELHQLDRVSGLGELRHLDRLGALNDPTNRLVLRPNFPLSR